ncbi:MAG: tRNA (N(6)-L-threonylcarbamoyladenosine(37)-C(2))-methylthiotransferase MtaB [Deltaproteobacteria bacterium]|nr:tRNA (N(6)-L-threonylcarbamoyladenosine(37)-C(2))-methylthiotransferase MtaB [Deltaproteobacteria bacterium]MBW2300082.1 tRNA (N(6)-L-threonylcarbamoyladenosine(37)-C(2))-methylthiotransferase MtaB [Deltaproteobacteria bacterium]
MVGPMKGTNDDSGSFRIVTLGCKVNQYESTFLKEALLRGGWTDVSANKGAADLYVINTCIVTQRASYQSRQAVRRAIRDNPSAVVAATGCYAQVYPEELSNIKGLDLVVGNTMKAQLPNILQHFRKGNAPCIVRADFASSLPFEFLPVQGAAGRTRAFLKIQDGCNAFCTYCIVPFARGPLRSLDPQKVLSELHGFSDRGYKEVVLTGIHLGKYGEDLAPRTNLKSLLHLIGRERLALRIRLSSIEANEIDPELIEMVASERWLCRHFHVPLQSGDDAVLKKMKRDYSSMEFARLIERIYEKIPFAAIGVDVMAGFPGESAEAYRNTLALLTDLPISYLHVFPYSARKGTAAFFLENRVDPAEVKRRTAELRELGRRKREAFYRSCLGEVYVVITEGWESEQEKVAKGFSDNYLKICFSAQKATKEKIVPVMAQYVNGNKVYGRVVRSRTLAHYLR